MFGALGFKAVGIGSNLRETFLPKEFLDATAHFFEGSPGRLSVLMPCFQIVQLFRDHAVFQLFCR